ncbi:hypothetical protein YQE_06551, partial [Dendroctonus ponderosae]
MLYTISTYNVLQSVLNNVFLINIFKYN